MTKSSLDKPTGKSALTDEEMFRLAKAAWHQRWVLSVPMANGGIIIDDFHRLALLNVGEKIYGETTWSKEAKKELLRATEI